MEDAGLPPTLLNEILAAMSPALITEEQELLIVNLFRNLLVRPPAPRLLEGKRVNVLNAAPGMAVVFDDSFSFAPLFSTLSQQQAARLAALIIAYAYDPRLIYVYFIAHMATVTSAPFLGTCEAIEKAFRFTHMRRAARIVALHELWAEGRIVCAIESSPVMRFLHFFDKLSKDVRLNVLLKFACTNAPIHDEDEKIVCLDTVSVWMRCGVLERRSGNVFVHYGEERSVDTRAL